MEALNAKISGSFSAGTNRPIVISANDRGDGYIDLGNIIRMEYSERETWADPMGGERLVRKSGKITIRDSEGETVVCGGNMKTFYADLTALQVRGASMLYGYTKILGSLSFNDAFIGAPGANIEIDAGHSVYYFDAGGTLTLPDDAAVHPEGRILFVKGRGVTLKGKLMRPAGCEIITEYNLGSNSALLVEMHGAWCIFYCG